MTSPRRLNTGNDRPVTEYKVLNAEDRGVERQQLNRILLDIRKKLDELETPAAVTTPPGGTGDTGSSSSSSSQASATISSVEAASISAPNPNYTLSFLLGGM